MELLSADNRQESISKIPLKELLSQHRQRYLLKTGIGDIVLKRITFLDMESETMKLISEETGYLEAVHEAGILSEKAKYENSLTPAEMARYNELGTYFKRFTPRFYAFCFVEPDLTMLDPLESFEAILGALNPVERNTLMKSLVELTNPSPGEVRISGLIVAQENGIPVSTDLNLENMTMQQAQMFTKKAEMQNRNIRDILK